MTRASCGRPSVGSGRLTRSIKAPRIQGFKSGVLNSSKERGASADPSHDREPAQSRGARWDPAGPRSRDTVDSVGKAYGSDATGTAPPVANRSGCPGDQFIVRVHAGAVPGPQRPSHTSSFPLGSQRYGSEPRAHRGRVRYGLYAFRLAGFISRARHRCDERTRRTGSLEGSPQRTQGCRGSAVSAWRHQRDT